MNQTISGHSRPQVYDPIRRRLFRLALALLACLSTALTADTARSQESVADETTSLEKPRDASSEDPRATRLERLLRGEAPRSIEDLVAMQGRFRELAARVRPATVGVVAGGNQGSGVIVDPKGLVLTAAHVTGRPGRKVQLILEDGRRVSGESLGTDHDLDAGLIRISEEGEWSHAPMAPAASLKEGQWCLATGHPGGWQSGRTAPVRVGRILDKRPSLVRTDCLLVGGDSGGPLFDMEGRVVGIHSRISQSPRSNIHVPIDAWHTSWKRFLDGENWGGGGGGLKKGGPFLGVHSDRSSDEAKIREVVEDSPAEKAGILAGDVIVRFDGEPVRTFGELGTRARTKKPGDVVTIVVRRGEKTVDVELIVGSYKGEE